MNVLRITNPLWLGTVAPLVNAYNDKVDEEFHYEALWTHFCNVVQNGGNVGGFSVVMDKAHVVAFAQYEVEPLPYHGTVSLKHIYSESEDNEAVSLLCDEIIKFGLQNRCTKIVSHSPNRKVQNHFAELLKQKHYSLEPIKRFHWIATQIKDE